MGFGESEIGQTEGEFIQIPSRNMQELIILRHKTQITDDYHLQPKKINANKT